MKRTILLLIALILFTSCSIQKHRVYRETDDLYFMASDANLSQFAVNNNNSQSFELLENVNSAEFEQENFSARNVNPEYIAKYQSHQNDGLDRTVNVYNNYGFSNPWMMNSMFMGGFSPFGIGFYDPFFGPFYNPFGITIGMGFGYPFMRRGFGYGGLYDPFFYGYGYGYPFMRRGFGYSGFYDPFFSGYGTYHGYGGFGSPIYNIPSYRSNNRQIVRGARPTRGAGLSSSVSRRSTIVSPNTSRAVARRASTNINSRGSNRDFNNSQNSYYRNSRIRNNTSSAVPSSRNVGSAANIYQSGTRIRSSSSPNRNIVPNTRSTRTTYRNIPSRTPSRSSSPSYNRNTNPSYNRNTNPINRTVAPSRSGGSTPTRSSIPSYSAPPSRSTGGSTGGRSSSGRRGGNL